MKISRTHQNLSNYLKTPKVITNPQKFFGPNWETVLRWWLYRESLTDEQARELSRRWCAIDDDTRDRAGELSLNAADEVIGIDNSDAVWYVTSFPAAITMELIAMHLLLERGQSLTFVPLIKDL